uniref:Mid2 domain-containing protein n=2 Tax=Psilocybe cubensis TaxID=181762 RepID=A0A8H7XUJ2_PSICU
MLTFGHSGRISDPILATWNVFPRFLLLLLVLNVARPALSQELQNLSIPLTSPQIIYTPFLCNATTVSNNPQGCAGAWQLSNSTDPASTVVSTFGPASVSSNIIPQLFFQFSAFSLGITTLPSSNATVNVTMSSNGIVVSSLFNSSLGSLAVINLPDNSISQFTINFIPSSTPTRFDLQSLVIAVPADAVITSFLPSQSLPPSIALPTFSTTASSTSASASPTTSTFTAHSNKKMIAQAVGLTVGLGLGLTAVAVMAFYYWRRRRRQHDAVSMQDARSGWTGERPRRFP